MKIGCVFKFSALSIGNLLSTVQDEKVTNDADLCKAVHTALGGMWDRDGSSFLKYVGKLEYFANFSLRHGGKSPCISKWYYWVQIVSFQSYCRDNF